MAEINIYPCNSENTQVDIFNNKKIKDKDKDKNIGLVVTRTNHVRITLFKLRDNVIKLLEKISEDKDNTYTIEAWDIFAKSNYSHNQLNLCFNCQEIRGLLIETPCEILKTHIKKYMFNKHFTSKNDNDENY